MIPIVKKKLKYNYRENYFPILTLEWAKSEKVSFSSVYNFKSKPS